MFEIEQKYTLTQKQVALAKLQASAATSLGAQTEIDHYFNAPDRDFAITGEAFRLRRVKDDNQLTYKGPKDAKSAVKIRKEIELSVESGIAGYEKTVLMLTSLGYRPVAVVKKQREMFRLAKDSFEVTICIDECEHVGNYAEIEIIVVQESHRDHAIKVIEKLAQEYAFGPVEKRSYLRMLLEKTGEQ
jgi:adenylate cyclase, class 2